MAIIKVERNEAANCINFDGSSVPAYFNACLSATAAGDLVSIRNDIRSKQIGADFFEFSNIHYTDFRDQDGNPFATAQDAADYITLNGNVAAPSDINVGYLGTYDASTNTPDITTDLSGFKNGDWYFVDVAGTQVLSGVSYDLEVNDQVKFTESSQTWSVIVNPDARLDDIENSALAQFDLYVDANYTGTTRTGTNVHPFNNLTDAIAASSAGNSISIKGTITVANSASNAYSLPHSLFFYGTERAVIKYASYDATNGSLFDFNGTDNSQEFRFENIDIENAGAYGLHIRKPLRTVVKDCVFKFNGWNGTQLNTVVSSSVSGLLGYDSSQADLQNFYASTNASNGGAIRVEESVLVEVVSNTVTKNLRGIRLQDCGIDGQGIVSRNRAFNNIESGIYLASSSYDATNGCENFTVYNNASQFNANNGILVIGGINNVVSLNIVEGNWNAGIMAWHVSNTRFRDLDLTNNNRTLYNGIGNNGDADSSIQISGDTARADRSYILDVLSTEVYNTGTGAIGVAVGLTIGDELDNITGDYGKNLINIDNVGFKNQDYAIAMLCDLDLIRVTIGDCRYIDTTFTNVHVAAGYYYSLPYSNHHTNTKDLDFSLDSTGTQVIIKEGINASTINTYGINTIQAYDFNGTIRVLLKDSKKIQIEVPETNVSIDAVILTGTISQKINAINALVQNSGSPAGQVPSITSSLAVSLTQGQTLNYELTDVYGVGYEWDLSNVPGITTIDFNPRKLIGGSSLAVGTYNIPVKAINYNGEDSQTLVLTVDTPPFSNTKSVRFSQQDWLGANASQLEHALGRSGNGSGSGDAWTISFWFNGSTSTSGAQTVFYYGDNDTTNGGNLHLLYSGNFDRFRFHYGSNNNNIRLQTANNSVAAGNWYHVLISYDGGTTGSSSGDIGNYYSRFKIYINGALQSTTNTNSNYGWSSGIDPDNWRIGRLSSGNYMRDGCKVDEFAVFDSDQSANISTLYNSGSPFDLMTLTTQPKHWWRMGDGDTFPNLQDRGSEANCVFVMNNMTSADIVSDVP